LKYKFIESDEELNSICEGLSQEKIIGVDLEADSMYCFKEKICLIQIATAKEAFLIDPFVIKDIAPFLDVLAKPDVIKIFHGSDFDVRSFDRDHSAKINNLFDTEIACRFLGLKERGLGALLKRFFDLDVDKRFQKVDWSRRPLSNDMIEYSVGDVSHLVRLYDIIYERLQEKKRLAWAEEEFELQTKVRYENNHALPLFKKFKGAGKMDNRSLAVLESLLKLRLVIAESRNFPLYKIFSNASLTKLAVDKPVTMDQMLRSRAFSKKQAGMYGGQCLDAIVRAVELEHKDLPSYPKTRMPKKDAVVHERIDSLKKMREDRSLRLGIELGFLLNNAMIDKVAVQNPKTLDELLEIENMRRWQVEAVGQDIITTLGYCK
jgi:ribonuclease D